MLLPANRPRQRWRLACAWSSGCNKHIPVLLCLAQMLRSAITCCHAGQGSAGIGHVHGHRAAEHWRIMLVGFRAHSPKLRMISIFPLPLLLNCLLLLGWCFLQMYAGQGSASVRHVRCHRPAEHRRGSSRCNGAGARPLAWLCEPLQGDAAALHTAQLPRACGAVA